MDIRQKQILMSLIDDYIETARPVSSASLSGKFDLSPATLRLELVDLMQQGYLLRPYISSGRVPTDKAYRFYVKTLATENDLLTSAEKTSLRRRLGHFNESHRLMQETVKVISELSHNLALGFLAEDFFEFGLNYLFQEPEFEDRDLILDVSRFFDLAGGLLADLIRSVDDDEVSIFIGQQGPFKSLPECSLLSSHYQLSSGESGLLSILGPKRMNYQRNISLLEYASRLLAE